jgi:hypothetical protein
MAKLVADNSKELLSKLQEITTELSQEVADVFDEDANFNPSETEWCVKEILCYLRDADQITTKRIKIILEDDEPFLQAFNPQELAIEHDYKGTPWQEARNNFLEARQTNLQLLASLQPIQWLKGAIHQERGHVTIQDLAESLQQYSQTYLEQIRHVLWLAK